MPIDEEMHDAYYRWLADKQEKATRQRFRTIIEEKEQEKNNTMGYNTTNKDRMKKYFKEMISLFIGAIGIYFAVAVIGSLFTLGGDSDKWTPVEILWMGFDYLIFAELAIMLIVIAFFISDLDLGE